MTKRRKEIVKFISYEVVISDNYRFRLSSLSLHAYKRTVFKVNIFETTALSKEWL